MASIYSAENMVGYNRQQIKNAAKNLGILHDNSETPASLTAKVKAK